MNNFRKLLITLSIGAFALTAEFIFHQPTVAYWIVASIGGLMAFSMFISMIKTLRSGKYGVDILAITAIVATLIVGEYWASLMVLIMLTGGDSLEDYASKQAGKELRALLHHSPQIAHKITENELQDLPVEAVRLGDTVLVKPGELVPVDGIVTEGFSTFDESSLTGESVPVEKKQGDELMSGSVNGDRTIRFKVTKLARDSQYQTLVKLVKESEAKPAHFVRLADRYAVPFTLIAYIIGGLSWFISKDPVRFAEVLVVASPCPLILAAPVALVAGMSRSSRNGIVVKTGTTLEKLAAAKSIAFDKTGTITEGRLFVDQIFHTIALTEHAFIQLTASAEQESSHILARSLVHYAKEKNIVLLPVQQLEELTGRGIQAVVDEKVITIGRAELIKNGLPAAHSSQTSVFVSVDDQYVGQITFKDIVRTEAKQTIHELQELGLQRVLMLTGDKETIARPIAAQVGITHVHANCLPEDKISLVKNMDENQRPVVMVGDGVNDAPALAVADVGIAMGAHGSTAASESADAVILKDDLSRVAAAVQIAQDTMRIAKQSVLIGIFICVLLMLIASTGLIPALLGAALQEVIDTVSIISALRAKNDRKITTLNENTTTMYHKKAT